MLIAAIDPAAEARLDGLNHAVISGQYLPENGFGTGPDASYYGQEEGFPVLAAADSGIGEYSVTQVQELAAPSAPPVLGTAAMRAGLRDARPPRAQHYDHRPARVPVPAQPAGAAPAAL